MAFQKGKSGNPNGRPTKKRSLAEALSTSANATVDGVTRKRQIADLVTSALATGRLTFPTGREVDLPFAEWFEFMRWFAHHTDGPVPQQVEAGHSGEIILRVEYGSRNRNQPEESPPETG